MSEIVLIKPPPPGKYKELGKAFQEISSVPCIGLLYIAQFLIQHRFTVSILDLTVNTFSKNKFMKILEDEQPKIVGVSVLTEFYYSAVEVAKTIREWNPDTIIIFGGQHVTFIDDEALKTCVVDIVVRHEGEITMLELAEHFIRKNGKKLSEIKGITYLIKNQNGFKIKRNPSRPPIQDLDALPFPARNLIDLGLYAFPYTLLSSRGCPAKCIYCAAKSMSGKTYRFRSPKNVISEIAYLYKEYDIHNFQIVDDAFTVKKRRVVDVCNYLINVDFDLMWECISRADYVDQNILKKLADAGCVTIQFGIESGNQLILNSINKNIEIKQIENAVKNARKVGILPVCSFILGHHTDTKETVQETLKFAENLRNEYDALICFSINTPFPGTYTFHNYRKLGITFQANDWTNFTLMSPVISTSAFSKNDLQHLYFEIKQKFDDSQDKDVLLSKIWKEKLNGGFSV